MHQSHIVEVFGRFAGAVMHHDGSFRFVAVDPRAIPLDRTVWRSLSDAHGAVARLLRTEASAEVRGAAPRGRA